MGVQCSIAMERVKGTFATDTPCLSTPPNPAFTTTTLAHVCMERYSCLEHVVKKTNTYRDMYVIWTCINFTMFWRKNMQDTAILPSPFQTLLVVWEVVPVLCFSRTCSRPPHGQVGHVGRGQYPKGWVLDQSGKVMVRHPCSRCLFMQRFLLSRFPLQHLYSQSFLQILQSLIWGFDVVWIYTIHYTHKKTFQVFTAALHFTAHTQAWLSIKGSPVADNLLENTACSQD